MIVSDRKAISIAELGACPGSPTAGGELAITRAVARAQPQPRFRLAGDVLKP